MLNTLSPTDHERLSRVGALGVGVVAAACCVYLLVRLVWFAIPQRDATPAAAPATTASADAVLSVAKWHLFGNPQGIATAAPASSLATILKLGLHGTLALPDPKDERALAIIANEQGAEASFRIGADVTPGAKLAEVYADHVVLDHQGVAETLALPRPEQHALGSTPQRATGAAASIPPGIMASAGAPSAVAPAAVSKGAAAAKPVDPQAFASQIRPVFADGRMVGADISGADAATLARVGLKPTDVVTAINGTPLAQVSNPQALMNQLQNNASIQVTVTRDGRPATLTLSLR